MNKQELIEKIKKAITDELSGNYYREVDNYGHTEYERYSEEDAQSVANDIILDLEEDLKQLNEPQKPVVPKFVADWFEENKDDLEFAIWELCVDSYGSAEQGMLNWIQQSENNPIETLIRMKDGYEVEKEPLYRVKLGEGYFVEYQGRGALIIPDGNKEIKLFDSKSDAERTAQTIGGSVVEVAEG